MQVHRRAPPTPFCALTGCAPRRCRLPPFPRGASSFAPGDGAVPSPTRLRRGRRTPGSRPVGSHGRATRQQAGCERTNGQLSAILSRAHASASRQVFLNRTGTARPARTPEGVGVTHGERVQWREGTEQHPGPRGTDVHLHVTTPRKRFLHASPEDEGLSFTVRNSDRLMTRRLVSRLRILS